MASRKTRRQRKISSSKKGTKRRRHRKPSGLKLDLERKYSLRYRATAKQLSRLVPSLKTLDKPRLSNIEKAKVTRYAKALSGVDNLQPVSAAYAKKYPNELFHGKDNNRQGIRAIRLRNTSSDAKVKFKTTGDINVVSNGRTWIYWRLDRATVRNKKGQLGNKAADAFAAKFPIEVVNDLAEKAFKELDVELVYLWTNAGRSGDGFASLRQFILWMQEKWQAGRYVRMNDQTGEITDESDPAAWISGLAIMLKNPKTAKQPKRKK